MYRSILVPLDGSPFAEQSLPIATSIAKKSHATLTLVRVWDPSSYRDASELVPPAVNADAPERVAATEYLDAVATRLRSTSESSVNVSVRAGRIAGAIEECATEIGADLIVMTTHGRTGVSRAWLGSVTDAVVRLLAIPVLLWRPVEAPSPDAEVGLFRRIVIALDGSEAAEEILPHITAVGTLADAAYTLVRVVRPVVTPVHPYAYTAPAWQDDPAATEAAMSHARSYLGAIADRLKRAHPAAAVEIDVRLDQRVGSAIVDAVRDHSADLVALTTHARRGVRLLLGSVADKVLRGTEGAILVLHPAAH